MEAFKYEDMIRGWFVGGFTPTAHKTVGCEVGVKNYKAGEKEDAHYHKAATEITMILKGSVKMNDKEYHEGDIIVVSPGEIVRFETLTEVTNVVIKTPGALDDKYLEGE